jgi:hypothetical protein
MLPKMMIFNSDVLGPMSKFWIPGHSNTGLIVFPHFDDESG